MVLFVFPHEDRDVESADLIRECRNRKATGLKDFHVREPRWMCELGGAQACLDYFILRFLLSGLVT